MDWASKRKLLYTASVAGVILVLMSIPAYFSFNKAPSCFDKKQNQEEVGIDCGGPCNQFCISQVNPPITHWSRAFKVSDGEYDIVASIENSNIKAATREAIYRFKVYDEDNILIVEKFGKTFIMPGDRFVIFESGVSTGERTPKRVFFEFQPDIKWERLELDKNRAPKISTKNRQLTSVSSQPRLKTILVNDSPLSYGDFKVNIVIYDKEDNAIAVSSTYVDEIEKNNEKQIFFTWQEPFTVQPVRIDVIPRINLFNI